MSQNTRATQNKKEDCDEWNGDIPSRPDGVVRATSETSASFPQSSSRQPPMSPGVASARTLDDRVREKLAKNAPPSGNFPPPSPNRSSIRSVEDRMQGLSSPGKLLQNSPGNTVSTSDATVSTTDNSPHVHPRAHSARGAGREETKIPRHYNQLPASPFGDSNAGRRHDQTPGAHQAGFEDIIEAKMRQAQVGGGGSGTRVPPRAHRELRSLEDIVNAKIRDSTPRDQPADVPPDQEAHARGELRNLEDIVDAKLRRYEYEDSSAVIPPGQEAIAHQELRDLEDSVDAKMQANPSHDPVGKESHIQGIVNRASAKGIPGDDDDTNGLEAIRHSNESNFSAGLDEEELPGAVNVALHPWGDGLEIHEYRQSPTKRRVRLEESDREVPTLQGIDGGKVDVGVGNDDEVASLEDLSIEIGNTEGLAVATMIEEDVENMFMPSAIEYDPDAKVPIQGKRPIRLYACVTLSVVTIVGLVGAVIGVATKDSSTDRAAFRKSLGIQEQVEQLVGSEVLEESTSPYSKALHWITLRDLKELHPKDTHFYQRYILAYLYFATTEKHPWDYCNPPTDEEDDSCTSIRFSEADSDPVPGYRWLSATDECLWAGVDCDSYDQVRGFNIAGFNTTGTIPEGVLHLPLLQSLDLGHGQLKGSIPGEILKMQHLHEFDVEGNLLSGEIPRDFWQLKGPIRYFNVGKNKLSGSLPEVIPGVRDIRRLLLGENLLKGTIPKALGGLSSLAYLVLNNNLLVGTIPSELGNIVKLFYFEMHDNDLSGTIPPEVAKPFIVDFKVQNNPRLSGMIPEEVFHEGISALQLFNCNFTGTISEKLGEATELTYFEVQNNNLHGQIPTDLSKLVSLRTFKVFGNDLTGSIPGSLCALQDEKLSRFTGVEADCRAPDNGSEPEISCELGCCTACCNAAGDDCIDPTDWVRNL